MILKRIIMVLVVVLVSVCFIAIAGAQEKYSEVRELVSRFLTAIDDFDKTLDSNDSKKVATGLIEFSRVLNELEPEMSALEEKYPELAGDDVPPELQELMDEMAAVEEKMNRIFEKLKPYLQDEDVMNALQNLGR